MKRLAPALLLPFAVAACGGPAGNQMAGTGNGSSNGAASQAAATGPAGAGGSPSAPQGSATPGAGQMQAGQWELTATVRSLETPGVPPAQQAAMRQRVGRPLTRRICMSEEQVRDFARFATPPQQASGCRTLDRVYAGGVIRLGVSCPMPGGRPGTVRMSTQGSYTPTSIDLAMHQEMPNPGRGGGEMRMSATISGRRVGACPAGSAQMQTPRIRPPSNGAPVVVPAPPPVPR
jgi:hypothetical protein